MEKLKESILKVLQCFGDVKLCIVFGSVASGKASNKSDLDIAIAEEQPMQEGRFLELAGAFAEAMNRDVDIIDLNTSTGPILKHALSKGTVILNRDKNLYATLISRMLFNESDMMPYYHRTLEERRKRFLNG